MYYLHYDFHPLRELTINQVQMRPVQTAHYDQLCIMTHKPWSNSCLILHCIMARSTTSKWPILTGESL